MVWVKNNYFQWAVSGLLLGVGFVHQFFWIFGLLGGVYFIYLLTQEESFKKACLGAWLAWTIKSACALLWFYGTYPIEWLPVQFGDVQLLLIFGYWSTASMWLGLGGIFVATIYHVLRRRATNFQWFIYGIVLPAAWVVGETIGSLVFSIFSLGPGGSVNMAFSFGYSGYLFAQHEGLLQVARLVGVYGLSFLFTLSCTTLFLIYFSKKQSHLQWAAITIGFIYATSFGSFFHTGESLLTESYQVVTIDTKFSSAYLTWSELKTERQAALEEAVTSALRQKADYILLPEDARFFDQQRSPELVKGFFRFKHSSPEVVIVDSGRVNDVEGAILQTFIYNGSSTVEQVHKRYLVPQGEYMPVIYSGILKLFTSADDVRQVNEEVNYRVGEKTDQSNMARNVPGILFCSESINPLGVHAVLQERPRAPFVAHVVSHAWFHEPHSLWYQLDTMLKVQAVWNQKYIVSAGNQVAGKVYTPQGNIIQPTVVDEGEKWMVKQVSIPRLAE